MLTNLCTQFSSWN